MRPLTIYPLQPNGHKIIMSTAPPGSRGSRAVGGSMAPNPRRQALSIWRTAYREYYQRPEVRRDVWPEPARRAAHVQIRESEPKDRAVIYGRAWVDHSKKGDSRPATRPRMAYPVAPVVSYRERQYHHPRSTFNRPGETQPRSDQVLNRKPYPPGQAKYGAVRDHQQHPGSRNPVSFAGAGHAPATFGPTFGGSSALGQPEEGNETVAEIHLDGQILGQWIIEHLEKVMTAAPGGASMPMDGPVYGWANRSVLY